MFCVPPARVLFSSSAFNQLTKAYAGIALGWGMLWPLLLLPLAVGIIARYVIRAEEAYLDRLFGEDYRAYRRRVRRWLGQRRSARSPLDR